MPHTTREAPTIDDLIARVDALRPMLRAEQAACEERGHPSAEVHRAFADAGLFRMLTPRVYGGHQMTLEDFYRVVAAIARGCPSTGWWFALGAGHALQMASYFPEETQRAVFSKSPDFSAPWTFNPIGETITKVDGGYRVSGKWAYASGVPHSDYFMGGAYLKVPGATNMVWNSQTINIVIPKGGYTILDDWGDLMGMRGSGSNSVQIDDVFVPDHMVLIMNRSDPRVGDTPGSRLYGDPLYAGSMNAFVEGGLAAMAVGLARATIDEYLRIITTKKVGRTDQLRADNADFQRQIGLGVAYTDSAEAIVRQNARDYLEHSTRAVAGIPFDHEISTRMDSAYHNAERLVWETVELLFRTSISSSGGKDAPIQRYYRDVTVLRSRRDQLEFRAAAMAVEYIRKHAPKAG